MLVAILYHLRLVALSLTDAQFLIPITFILLKFGSSPFALTFLGFYMKELFKKIEKT